MYLKNIIFLLICFVLTSCEGLVTNPKLNQKDITKDTFAELTTESNTQVPRPKNSFKIKPLKESYPAVFYKKVSISFSDKISLTKVLHELAKSVGVDLQLDSSITSPAFFQATQEPFIEIVEDICDMANLRFTVKHNRIRIEKDESYSNTYPIQFLNLTRNSQNRISVATNIFNNAPQSNSSDFNTAQSDTKLENAKNLLSSSTGMSSDNTNGSESQLNVQTNNDFWRELETNLNLLIQETQKEPLKTPIHHQGKNAAANQKDIKSPPKPYFSLHKQGGLLTVFANSRAHKRIKTYLEQLRLVASSQVLIEAKIIEVQLNSEYKSGINWSRLNRRGLQLNGRFGDMIHNSRFADPSSTNGNVFSVGAVSSSFSSIIQLLEEFGHARTLSSPRLTVMNNQAAILKVAQNQVYFRLNYDKQNPSNLTPGNSSVSSTIHTVPIGLIMAVQPSINSDTGEIILFLRPTISKFNKSVADPAIDIAYNANLSDTGNNQPITNSNIPIVEVREIDSVMKLQDGEIGILGGLMEISSFEETNKIPGLGDVPVGQELFSSKSKGDQIVELVILLKVTIEKDSGHSDNADERLRKEYIADPRRWK